MKGGTKKHCRKNGRFVSCKKAKGMKRVKKTRCRKGGRFVSCKKRGRGMRKKKKTVKKRKCRNKGRFVKCDTDGRGFTDVFSALLGISQAKRKPPFIAVGRDREAMDLEEAKQKQLAVERKNEMAMEPTNVEFKKRTAEEYERTSYINDEGETAQKIIAETELPVQRHSSYEMGDADLERSVTRVNTTAGPNETTQLIPNK